MRKGTERTVKRWLGKDSLALAAEGTILRTEIVMKLGPASFAYVADSWEAPLIDQSLPLTVTEQGTCWHLERHVSLIILCYFAGQLGDHEAAHTFRKHPQI